MSLIFAVLTALAAAGAAFMVLDPLRRAARQPSQTGGVTGGEDNGLPGDALSASLLVEIEREVRAIRTRSRTRAPRSGGGA